MPSLYVRVAGQVSQETSPVGGCRGGDTFHVLVSFFLFSFLAGNHSEKTSDAARQKITTSAADEKKRGVKDGGGARCQGCSYHNHPHQT